MQFLAFVEAVSTSAAVWPDAARAGDRCVRLFGFDADAVQIQLGDVAPRA